jgi:hypothetical protein
VSPNPPPSSYLPQPKHENSYLSRQDLPPSTTTRTATWLRDSTARIFNTCRIPGVSGCDSLSAQPPQFQDAERNGNIGKLLVMVHDWCYTVEFYHLPNSNSNPSASPQSLPSSTPRPEPQRISPSELERRLRSVASDAARRLASGEKAFPVGVLSSDGRDRWAEVGHNHCIFFFKAACGFRFLFFRSGPIHGLPAIEEYIANIASLDNRTMNIFEGFHLPTCAPSKRSINPCLRSAWIITPTLSRPPHHPRNPIHPPLTLTHPPPNQLNRQT